MSMSYQDFWNLEKEFPSDSFDWRESGNNRSLRISIPLVVDGIIQEGFSFEGHTKKDLPEHNVTFLLKYNEPSGKARGVVLSRVDWRPLHEHNNHEKGPRNLRNIIQSGSHYHDFESNFSLRENVWINKRLPIASPINPDLADFQELLDFVGQSFKIPNIWLVQAPIWTTETQGDLYQNDD
jgi:hypothetical protein